MKDGRHNTRQCRDICYVSEPWVSRGKEACGDIICSSQIFIHLYQMLCRFRYSLSQPKYETLLFMLYWFRIDTSRKFDNNFSSHSWLHIAHSGCRPSDIPWFSSHILPKSFCLPISWPIVRISAGINSNACMYKTNYCSPQTITIFLNIFQDSIQPFGHDMLMLSWVRLHGINAHSISPPAR